MGPFDVVWVGAAIRLSTPILLASTGELVAQRAGVINVGLEGMMLIGAFTAYLVTWGTGSAVLGLLAGVIAGLLLAALMALLSVNLNADQIVVGVGLNLLALGVTTFMFQSVFASRAQVVLGGIDRVAIPGLSDLPIVGQLLFHQSPLVYIAWIAWIIVAVALARTTFGLAVRGAGEVPEAVEVAGVSVKRIRWLGTLAAGGLAGLGGGFLSVGVVGAFIEGMTAGRGFLALATVIFGRWKATRVLAASLLFGAADATQLRLQAVEHIPREVWLFLALFGAILLVLKFRSRPESPYSIGPSAFVTIMGLGLFLVPPSLSFPSQLWLALPFLLALVTLGGFVGVARMPRALGVPYRRAAPDATRRRPVGEANSQQEKDGQDRTVRQ